MDEVLPAHAGAPHRPGRFLAAQLNRLLHGASATLPRGLPLPERVWQERHRYILTLLWLHAISVAGYVLTQRSTDVHRIAEGVVLLVIATVAMLAKGRRVVSSTTSFGLVMTSALLVHLSGGYIEMHFHFFVMIVIIAFYQDWVPFLLALGFVVVHHGIFGVLDPEAVYNHPDAWGNPWKWAAIHGWFVLAACIASVVNWRLSESART